MTKYPVFLEPTRLIDLKETINQHIREVPDTETKIKIGKLFNIHEDYAFEIKSKHAIFISDLKHDLRFENGVDKKFFIKILKKLKNYSPITSYDRLVVHKEGLFYLKNKSNITKENVNASVVSENDIYNHSFDEMPKKIYKPSTNTDDDDVYEAKKIYQKNKFDIYVPKKFYGGRLSICSSQKIANKDYDKAHVIQEKLREIKTYSFAGYKINMIRCQDKENNTFDILKMDENKDSQSVECHGYLKTSATEQTVRRTGSYKHNLSESINENQNKESTKKDLTTYEIEIVADGGSLDIKMIIKEFLNLLYD